MTPTEEQKRRWGNGGSERPPLVVRWETFNELGLTRQELEKLIERYPERWACFACMLDSLP